MTRSPPPPPPPPRKKNTFVMTKKKTIHNIFIPRKSLFFWKQKIIEIQNWTPKIGQAYVYMKISEYTPPPRLPTPHFLNMINSKF